MKLRSTLPIVLLACNQSSTSHLNGMEFTLKCGLQGRTFAQNRLGLQTRAQLIEGKDGERLASDLRNTTLDWLTDGIGVVQAPCQPFELC